MSIFGVKKRKITENDLTLRVNELHRRVLPLAGLERRLTQFQQDVHNTRGAMLGQINAYGDRHKQLQDRVKEMAIEYHITKGKVELMKSTVTISAESKGALTAGELFSFGNGGRQNGVGYVVMRRGHITGISLSSERSSGEVKVGVSVNGTVLRGCEITLHTTPRKHDNFDRPFLVDAGSVINFVSLNANATALNTVASLLFEF